MALTKRRDLTRDLTPAEVDANFDEVEFQTIAANQYGTHPAFATKEALHDYLVSNVGTLTANASPTTVSNSYSTTQNQSLVITAANGVLDNDTDPEGNPLTAILVATTTNGSLSLASDGSFTYVPNTDYTGSDSFTYKSNDGSSDGNTVTVNLTINVATTAGQKLDIYTFTGTPPASPLVLPTFYGDSQGTHPDVLHFPTGWNGYTYWMTYTPYTDGQDLKENPVVVASNNGQDWVNPVGSNNPITPPPTDGSYFADTDLVYDDVNDRIICYYRGFTGVSPNGTTAFMEAKFSLDGITWSAPVSVYDAGIVGASAAIYRDGANYIYHDVNIYATPRDITKIVSTDPLDFNTPVATSLPVSGLPAGKDVWHINVLKVGDFEYVLMTVCNSGTNGGSSEMCFGKIENGAIVLNPTLLFPRTNGTWYSDNVYRGAFLVKEGTADGITFDYWMSGTDAVNDWRIGYTTFTVPYEITVTAALSEPEQTSPAFTGTFLLGGFGMLADGSKIYLGNGGVNSTTADAKVQQFNLTVNSDLSTIPTVASEEYAIVNSNYIHSPQIVQSGSTIYFGDGATSGKIMKLGLSTPYSVNTASFTYFTNVSGEKPRALFFSADGTKMFNGQAGSRTINAYTLSTPFEASTKTLTASYVHTDVAAGFTGGAISADGLTVVLVDQVTNKLRILRLGTANLISSVTEEINLPITGGTYNSLAWNDATGKLYLMNLDTRTIQKRTLTV